VVSNQATNSIKVPLLGSVPLIGTFQTTFGHRIVQELLSLYARILPG